MMTASEDLLQSHFFACFKKPKDVLHVTTIAISDAVGIPDTNSCLNGNEAWIEFKWLGRRPAILRPAQYQWFVNRTKADATNAWIVVGDGSLKLCDLYFINNEDVERMGVDITREIAKQHATLHTLINLTDFEWSGTKERIRQMIWNNDCWDQ